MIPKVLLAAFGLLLGLGCAEKSPASSDADPVIGNWVNLNRAATGFVVEWRFDADGRWTLEWPENIPRPTPVEMIRACYEPVQAEEGAQ